MKHLLIRHGKTDANRMDRAAFGTYGAPLNRIGTQQALALKKELVARGIDLGNEETAVSELLRTQETARRAGLCKLVIQKSINEVNTSEPEHTLALINHGKLPPEAMAAARALLATPPKQKIWVTHGLVIAAVLAELGRNDGIYIPNFCEIVEIDI